MKIRISNLCPVQTIRLRMLSPARALCMIATAAPALLILLTALPAAAQTSRPKSPPVDAVLQARKPPVTARTLADNTGQIWGTTPNALLRWDGQAGSWQETPITIPPRPQWLAHPAPPWQGWATPPRIIIGRGDYLLAVVVCDIYQHVDPVEFGHGGFPRPTTRTTQFMQELAAKHGGPYWLEAAVHHDGKWSDPQPLADLLTKQRQLILDHFAAQTPTPAFFDLQVVGQDLWWADGAMVHVLDSNGISKTWSPRPPDPQHQYLHSTNLVLLPDGKLWYFDEKDVTELKLTENAIAARPQSQAALPGGFYETPQVWTTGDGRVLRYLTSNTGFGGQTWFLEDDKWVRSDTLGLFILEDPDGALWFLPGGGEGSASLRGYNIVKGKTRFRLPIPGNSLNAHILHGHITAADKDTLIASAGDRILVIGRSSTPPGWAVRSAQGLSDVYEFGPVYFDHHGNLVGSTGWSAKVAPPLGARSAPVGQEDAEVH